MIINTANNCISANLIIYINWTNSLKDKLLRITQGEASSIPLYIKEIDSIMTNLPKEKTQGQIFKECLVKSINI